MSKTDEVLQGTIENHIAPFLWVHGEDHEAYRETTLAMHKADIRAIPAWKWSLMRADDSIA